MFKFNPLIFAGFEQVGGGSGASTVLVIANSDSAQELAASTPVTAQYTVSVYDPSSLYDGSVFTAPETGIYRVDVQASIDGLTEDTQGDGMRFQMDSEVNTVASDNIIYHPISSIEVNTGSWVFTGFRCFSLSADDELELIARLANATGDLNVDPAYCQLVISKIG